MENEKRYGFCYTKWELIDLKPYHVNTFWSIGLPDPFPDESTVLEKDNQLLGNAPLKIGKLIYPANRYRKGVHLMSIYVPS
jgi:hypothetical protein